MNGLVLFVRPFALMLIARIILKGLDCLSGKVKGKGWTETLWWLVFTSAAVWSIFLFNDWIDATSQEFGMLVFLAGVTLVVSIVLSRILAYWTLWANRKWLPKILQVWLCSGGILLTAGFAQNAVVTFGVDFGDYFLAGFVWLVAFLVSASLVMGVFDTNSNA